MAGNDQSGRYPDIATESEDKSGLSRGGLVDEAIKAARACFLVAVDDLTMRERSATSIQAYKAAAANYHRFLELLPKHQDEQLPLDY